MSTAAKRGLVKKVKNCVVAVRLHFSFTQCLVIFDFLRVSIPGKDEWLLLACATTTRVSPIALGIASSLSVWPLFLFKYSA